MKSLIRALLVVLVIVSWSTPAWVGTWTANEFVYKPSVGARGTAEKNLFDAALNRLDARLAKETWVGDPLYGATIQAAITALGSNAATLRIPPGTWSIEANFTIPSGITLKPERGAILAIANGVTLAINGGYEAGLYRTFACTGTGKVVFGPGAVKEVWVDWWGPAADGATDDSAKVQAAIDSLATAKGVVKVPGKSYALANTVYGRFGVTVEGIEDLTTFVPTGIVPAFGQIEDFYNNTIRTGYWIAFKNFNIDASANAHDLDLMYFNRHFNMCGLQNINFYGNPAQTQGGVHLYHTNPDSGAINYMYHNLFDGLNFYNIKTLNGCIFLEGNGALVRRANNNIVQRCKFTSYKVGTKIGGIGNRVQNNCYNIPDNPVLTDNTGGSDFRAIFYDGYNNVFENNWLEGGTNQVIAMMYGQGTGSASAVCDFPLSSVGLMTTNQIADLAVATPASYGNVAAYSAANTLVVEGADVHTTYPAGRQVWVDCGTDGWRTSTVSASTYSAPDTTIVLTTSVLTSNLATVSAGSSYGLRSGLANGPDLYYPNMRPSRLYTGIGATHYLSAAIKGSTTYDFSANPLTVNAGATASINITAAGAAANMAVSINASTTTIPNGILVKNIKTGVDTITIYFYNPTAGNITINTSQTFKWMVFDGA
ncbi:MAG: hypothetical protein M0P73_07400 [Syntrophobacterales bacterium]|jgi:hypothetical protein|nr:hypothetical protein [Syntrophobacterales bacterium]